MSKVLRIYAPENEFRYKIKEYRRHGEAGSADLAAVEAERIRMREVLAPFAKRDRWNFDEPALFAFAPPDRGLALERDERV